MCIDKMRYIMIGCALALIALAGCKTPELSMDERISLPESGEVGMNDTTAEHGAHRHEPCGLAAGEGAFAAGREFEHRSLREPFR